MARVFSPINVSDTFSHKALKLGNQHDAGDLWVAVANTEWGTIPGKAKDGNCWYSYGGEEHITQDFVWVTCDCPVELVKNEGIVPPLAVVCGYQDNYGYLYPAIADDDTIGRVPGKASGNTCWYPYGGKELATNDFYWIVLNTEANVTEEMSRTYNPVNVASICAHNALKLGCQKDAGDLYVAVAKTEWGTIPGKANCDGCWYSYGGKEHYVSDPKDFVWVTCDRPVKLVKNEGHPPELAIVCGYQDNYGYLYPAIADDGDLGRIPGKASGNTCWYPYGGEEKATNDFYWIVLA